MKIKFGVTKNELINKIKSLNEEDLVALRLSSGLTKVKFDWENSYIYNIEDPDFENQCKFREVFGTTILLTYAGGDWEYPVSFILYIDDKGRLKGFIPNAGNTYNKDIKQAFGNDIVADYYFLIDLFKANEMSYKEHEEALSTFKNWDNDYSLPCTEWSDLEELTEDDFRCIMSEDAMIDDFRIRITNEE